MTDATIQKKHIIIFDRYIYDIIYSLTNEFDLNSNIKKIINKIYLKLFFTPNIIYYINVNENIAYKRKRNEYEPPDLDRTT